MMRLFLLALLSQPAAGWVVSPSLTRRQIIRHKSQTKVARQAQIASDDAATRSKEGLTNNSNNRLSRRAILLSTILLSSALPAHAEEDMDDPLSAVVMPARWPNSLSPLPTSVGSGNRQQDDDGDSSSSASSSSSSSSSAGGAPPMSDLERALEQAKKKKRVEPRTHG